MHRSEHPQRPLPDDETLRLILNGTAPAAGADVAGPLVCSLAACLGVSGAWLTELRPDRETARILAFWYQDRFLEPYEYSLAGTPCERVFDSGGWIHHPQDVVGLYPRAGDLSALGTVGYLGLALRGPDGAPLGHLAILHTKPLPEHPGLRALFQIFAARAQAELTRRSLERELELHREQLAAVLANVLDAVLILDSELTVVRANRAAERLFRCPAGSCSGKPIRDFLQAGSASRLVSLVRGLGGRPTDLPQLWVSQDMMARRADGSRFAAECTLCRPALRDRACFILVLRDLDERQETQRHIQFLIRENQTLRESARDDARDVDLRGPSPAAGELLTAIQKVAATELSVLLHGELGVGKEHVAEAIHAASARASRPFLRIHCAATSAAQLAADLFGDENGIGPGGGRRKGRLFLADGGTLFLNEVSELPLPLQVRLLRLLREGLFEPIGASRPARVDVRIIAATRRDLRAMAVEGSFHPDLFFRLHGLNVRVPSLRERASDIGVLAQAFADRFARRLGRTIDPIAPEDLRGLGEYSWPGNLRELQSVVERAVLLAEGNRPHFELSPAGPFRTMPSPRAAPPGHA